MHQPEEGTITVETRNESSDGTSWFVLRVTDNGIGMDSATLGRIFRYFEQGSHAITRTFGGLGLGLAISKAIVELHCGTIAAHSEGPGKGAVFTVYLPTVPAPSPSLQAPPERSCDQPQSLQILLVEDHAPTAKALARLLARFGHTPHLAGDIAAALRLAREQRFDLVISDLGLPDGHGTTLMAELRKTGLKGIALSGYGMQEDVDRCMNAGFAGHLTKPITSAQLREAIRAVVAAQPPAPLESGAPRA
jgi:CheY-like chemotaxis protein